MHHTAEDVAERGSSEAPRIRGVQLVRRKELVNLFEQHDQLWHW